MTNFLKSFFVPASLPIKSILDKYLFVSDRSQQEINSFRSGVSPSF